MKRAVIAVIDDEPLIRTFVSHVLSSAGYAVHEFASGPTFLDQHHPATAGVILGLGMPGMDGPATLREMRRRRIELPVLSMSGGLPLNEADIARLGASEHLLKPFTVERLVAAVARLVGPMGGAVKRPADVSAEAIMKPPPDQPGASGMFTITRY